MYKDELICNGYQLLVINYAIRKPFILEMYYLTTM